MEFNKFTVFAYLCLLLFPLIILFFYYPVFASGLTLGIIIGMYYITYAFLQCYKKYGDWFIDKFKREIDNMSNN